MRKIDIFHEGQYLSENGTVIQTCFVDGRHPGSRAPISTLVKASERQFMIDRCRTVRITPPSLFREEGGPFIRDPGEGFASHTEAIEEVVDDPRDLVEARLMDQARNRGTRLASEYFGEGPHRPRVKSMITTRSIKRTKTSGSSVVFGKNSWIFCASVLPVGDDYREWKARMGDSGYEEESYIYSPREFARSLAEMIADQIGPTGSEVTLTSTFGRIPQPAVSAKAQSVYHGPMIYTNDVYSLLDSAETDLDFHLLSIFAKSEDHSHQCEYRFAAWSNEKPALEHRILQASPRLLLAMEDRAEPTPAITIPPARAATHPEERPISSSPLKRRSRPGELFDSFDFGDNPARQTVPRKISKTDVPKDFLEKTTEYSAVSALIAKVTEIPVSQRVRVAGAAFHAERYIRQLCAEFADPIKGISIAESDDIVVGIKFPCEYKTRGVFVVTAEGTASFELEAPKAFPMWTRGGETNSTVLLLLPSDIERLAEFGLPARLSPSVNPETETGS